jgi:nitrile hydratase
MSTRARRRFKTGDAVRVCTGSPPGHCRTPVYIQGKVGWIKRVYSAYRNPETLAHGGEGLPEQTLYLVAFRQRDVWGERYPGFPDDTVCVDIYDHWLEPA